MKIYELWGSTGSYSDYTEYRIAVCHTPEQIDACVAELLSSPYIEQDESRYKRDLNVEVQKDAEGFWSGRLLWKRTIKLHGMEEQLHSTEQLTIWSNAVEIDNKTCELFMKEFFYIP